MTTFSGFGLGRRRAERPALEDVAVGVHLHELALRVGLFASVDGQVLDDHPGPGPDAEGVLAGIECENHPRPRFRRRSAT